MPPPGGVNGYSPQLSSVHHWVEDEPWVAFVSLIETPLFAIFLTWV
jgi:hypothetical protein